MFTIDGKVALITGGASGLGLLYAKELLRNGLRACTLADINEPCGAKAVNEIREEFGENRVIFIKTDVTNKTQFEDAFKATINAFKNIDILINNAGILNDAIWEKQILININGTVHGCLLGVEQYLPKYKTGNEAVIVNIASVAGLDEFGSIPIYTATKHAVLGLSRSFGTELNYNRTKVKVITMCPGVTDTPLVDFDGPEVKTLSPDYQNFIYPEFKDLRKQPPIFVAKSMVRVIKEGNTGSVWIAEDEQPLCEVSLAKRDERRIKSN